MSGILIIALIIITLLVLFIGKKTCDMAIRVEVARQYSSVVFSQDLIEKIKSESEENEQWLENNSEEIELISRDGLKLKGYEIKNKQENNYWVIIVHGYLSRGSDMARFAKKFLEFGYNVLLVDLRAHGKSEGQYVGMGWLDHFDLELWIYKILEENKNAKIMLYGISMGAATVMMTTGEKLPENVKLAIADCGYSSVWEEFKIHLKKVLHLPAFPVLYAASIMSKIYAGYRFKEASTVNQVKKSKIPTLFIHGKEDKFVPFNMLSKIYESANCPKKKLEVEGAAHGESERIDTETYWRTILEFINKYDI